MKHIIYESFIDLRTIKCSCGNINCKIGISFDEPNLMRLQDKFGNEHSMHMNAENAKELIENLKFYLHSK